MESPKKIEIHIEHDNVLNKKNEILSKVEKFKIDDNKETLLSFKYTDNNLCTVEILETQDSKLQDLISKLLEFLIKEKLKDNPNLEFQTSAFVKYSYRSKEDSNIREIIRENRFQIINKEGLPLHRKYSLTKESLEKTQESDYEQPIPHKTDNPFKNVKYNFIFVEAKQADALYSQSLTNH